MRARLRVPVVCSGEVEEERVEGRKGPREKKRGVRRKEWYLSKDYDSWINRKKIRGEKMLWYHRGGNRLTHKPEGNRRGELRRVGVNSASYKQN